ncbi:MAG: Uma2 family endonuclease [Myxacorys chilensis ATA2-1-KO14]|nr:Uma2 family endonuclease [Myxacorys chilensis ATA2-1-KO14]
MVQTPSKALTIEEFLQLPETEPASEYINGQIIQKPMPQGEHSVIQGDLVAAINTIVKPQKIARALPELRCTFGGRAIVPDIAVFTYDRVPRKNNGVIANHFTIAPDWTIEILSPDQRSTKVMDKILHCLSHGTQMGWIIDPAEQAILVYPSQKQPILVSLETPESFVSVPEFAEAVKLTVGEIFGWLSQ